MTLRNIRRLALPLVKDVNVKDGGLGRGAGAMKRSLFSIGGLTLLLFALDRLYRVLHPDVNLVRASLVGLTALVALAPLRWLPRPPIQPCALRLIQHPPPTRS